MTSSRDNPFPELPAEEKIGVDRYWFTQRAQDVFERRLTGTPHLHIQLTAQQFADQLAGLAKDLNHFDALLSEVEYRSWDLVAVELRKRRNALATTEGAKVACEAFMEGVQVDILLAQYENWLLRRGSEFESRRARLYWFCRDYLAMVNDDASRTDTEDFPLQHRHYAAQSLAAKLVRLAGETQVRSHGQ